MSIDLERWVRIRHDAGPQLILRRGAEEVKLEVSAAGVLTVDAHLSPNLTATRDIGAPGTRWRDGWFSRDVTVGGALSAIGNVGIGTTSPGGLLHLSQDSAFTFMLHHSATATAGTEQVFRRSRGTTASPTNVGSTDIIARIISQPYASSYQNGAEIRFNVDGSYATKAPTRIGFFTNAANTSPAEVMRLTGEGRVLVGTTAAGSTGVGGIRAVGASQFDAGIFAAGLPTSAPASGGLWVDTTADNVVKRA